MALPLSVAIVCKNNERTIGRTLDSVAGLADEIVAIDSGSTDGTIAMLERLGARVIRSPWLGHVKTKQLALESCERPWVLSVDSDESVEPALAASLKGALERDDASVAGFEVNRKVFYRGRALNHAWQPEWRLRLVRRGQAAWGGLDPHDSLRLTDPAARSGRLAGDLRHDSIPSFGEFLTKQAEHARTMARSMHAGGQRGSLLRLCVSPTGAFLKQLIGRQAWRDGWAGWAAAGTSAASTLMKHVMLLELSRSPTDHG